MSQGPGTVKISKRQRTKISCQCPFKVDPKPKGKEWARKPEEATESRKTLGIIKKRKTLNLTIPYEKGKLISCNSSF